MKPLFTIATAAFCLVAASLSASAEAVKIGVIGIMSGAGATWGVAGVQGMQIAIDEVNKAGGLDINGTRQEVQLIVYDDQYKAAEAVAAYNRLVNEDKAKFIFTMSSASTLAIRDQVEADDVLVLTSAYTSKAIDSETKHIIRLYSTPQDYVPAIIGWMKAHLPGDKVVLVYPNDETGWDFANFSSKAFETSGYKIIGKELYDRAQKDFQPLMTRVIAQNPDVIDFGPTSPSTAGLILRQARELGYKGGVSALGGSGPREVVAAAGAAAAEGMVNMLYADHDNESYQALAKTFRDKIGQDPNELIVPYYDATRVLMRAMELSGEPENPEKVRAALSQALPMKSLQGEDIAFGGKATIGTDAQFMTVNYIGNIRNGEPVAVGLAK
ncbi:ABC transporter substrate-binding protein [Paracoccus pantotrophus]|uniref:ABC transporter substrate-binding protein n=1 Tax=Paracoccus pantotrophus TaxID=82367 RepID=UPI0009DF8866|nr:ABC transporter substrate-binding protein [Paracoccus pantotrophus]